MADYVQVYQHWLTTKLLARPDKDHHLQLFHVVLNKTHVDYAALLWWDFMNNVFQKKEVIQYPSFIKLIRIKRWMNFKEYETVFMKVDVPMNQPKRKQIAGESSSPQKSLKITIKQKQIVEKDYDDYEDRIEPGSHKDNPKVVDDDDDKEKEKILSSDKKTFQELTDIVSNPTTSTSKHSQVKKRISSKYSHLPRALRKMCRRQVNTIIEDHDAFRSEVPAFISKEFKAHAPAIIKELFKNHVQSNVIHVHPTTTTSTKTKSSANLQHNCESIQHLTLLAWENDFHSHQMNTLKTMMLLLEGGEKIENEQNVKKIKIQHQEWDAREEDNVVDEDVVISEEVTPKLIAEFQNVDKRVPTIFDHTRMEATLRYSLSNLSRNSKEYAYHLEQSTNFMENQIVWESRQQNIPRIIPKTLIFYGPQRNPNKPPRPLYNKDLFFLKYGNTKEKKYILSLHKIHAEEFSKPDMEEKLNRWVRKEFKTFNEDARVNQSFSSTLEGIIA
ncbi:hypothetical protein Tco_1427633 [Tanacetum coccineum]